MQRRRLYNKLPFSFFFFSRLFLFPFPSFCSLLSFLFLSLSSYFTFLFLSLSSLFLFLSLSSFFLFLSLSSFFPFSLSLFSFLFLSHIRKRYLCVIPSAASYRVAHMSCCHVVIIREDQLAGSDRGARSQRKQTILVTELSRKREKKERNFLTQLFLPKTKGDRDKTREKIR